ncbi:hypothetical protein IPF86_01575 [Candidatus Nomurabacteria bacterium]|nr:MAG: hypothetical protein IPF86_01575 [Candidatus Nomurabacteria bacterium]
MNKKFKLVILITGILLIAFIAIGFFIKKTDTNPNPSNIEITLRNLFPFGQKTNDNPTPLPPTNDVMPPGSVPGEPQPIGEEPLLPKLRHITTEPVAGAIAFLTTRTIVTPVAPAAIEGDSGGIPGSLSIVPPPIITTVPATAIRYIETKTAHAYETYTDSLQTKRISNTTIPRIHEAIWDASGTSVILRYLDDATGKIKTYMATFIAQLPLDTLSNEEELLEIKEVPLATTPYTLEGTFMPENITEMTKSSDGTKIFYTFPTDGGLLGISTDFAGIKKSQFWNSAFTEWLMQYANSSTIVATTKPAGILGGYVYSINATTGTMTKILGNVPGVTTLMSPDGKKLIYGATIAGSYSLYSYDVLTHVSANLGLATLPEKCTWGIGSQVLYCGIPKALPVETYPDAWYQGKVAFDDSLWRINLTTNIFANLVDPSTINQSPIDMTKLFTDPSEKFIYFTNKIDGSLWSYQFN